VVLEADKRYQPCAGNQHADQLCQAWQTGLQEEDLSGEGEEHLARLSCVNRSQLAGVIGAVAGRQKKRCGDDA